MHPSMLFNLTAIKPRNVSIPSFLVPAGRFLRYFQQSHTAILDIIFYHARLYLLVASEYKEPAKYPGQFYFTATPVYSLIYMHIAIKNVTKIVCFCVVSLINANTGQRLLPVILEMGLLCEASYLCKLQKLNIPMQMHVILILFIFKISVHKMIIEESSCWEPSESSKSKATAWSAQNIV